MSGTTDPISLPLPRAIVLDDDADTLAMLGRVLTRMGIDAVPAATCAAAEFAARTLGPPDLIVADVSLPDGSGVACAADLKATHGCATIAASGYPAPEDGLPAGIDHWMLKPIALDRLAELVRQILRDRGAGRSAGHG